MVLVEAGWVQTSHTAHRPQVCMLHVACVPLTHKCLTVSCWCLRMWWVSDFPAVKACKRSYCAVKPAFGCMLFSCVDVQWRTPPEASLFRTLTYLLASIYRFHVLASVSKAAAWLKFPPTRRSNPDVRHCLQQVDVWRNLWTAEKAFTLRRPCWSDLSVLQFVRNEADHHGRSSRSPVMLFDIQDNNNVNSFAVRGRSWSDVIWILHLQKPFSTHIIFI